MLLPLSGNGHRHINVLQQLSATHQRFVCVTSVKLGARTQVTDRFRIAVLDLCAYYIFVCTSRTCNNPQFVINMLDFAFVKLVLLFCYIVKTIFIFVY